ncbi:hypothetical protein [Chondromyces crocatus]|uniref:PBS lyase n=1 Tax=Chondromyces crocatus TaxID=52 RepID=A0A0K1EDH4_CHOCO|nr:hypothetical protein [Chondromyces crocatus]AKT38608.1 uncharacterized protein CMC5_027550 [Chondromyces crocatus]
MSTKGWFAALALTLGLATAGWPVEAQAAGAVISTAQLSPAERTQLTTDITKAKAAYPDAFMAVEQARQMLPELDETKRGRMAVVTPMLKSLGPSALHAMLEQLAIDGGEQGKLSESAWLAWRTSLIEATGMLRDDRAAPVLNAVLDGAMTDFEVMREAAAALGKLGTDAAATKLIGLATARGPKQTAILAGMGMCRRLSVAKTLATALPTHRDETTARLVVRALGDVGSAWAWKTPVIAASGEGKATRAEAARALVDAFVTRDGEVRRTAATAILVVDDPSTPALIEAARKQASAETAAALDVLARRFANSPLHRKP